MAPTFPAVDPPINFPIGRVAVVSSAVLVVAQGVLRWMFFNSYSLQLPSLLLGFFFCTELMWGTKWARWVVGIYMWLIFFSHSPTFGGSYPTRTIEMELRIFYLVFVVAGTALMFHRQVPPYLSNRREITTSRYKSLKYASRVLIVAGVLLVVALDMKNILGLGN